MAKQTHVVLIDDLTGETIKDGKGGAVRFALEGVEYQIDLTEKNNAKLRDVLAPYIAAGTKVVRARSSRPGRTQVGPTAREIRDWARSNGYSVPDRGRIPTDVRDAFDAR